MNGHDRSGWGSFVIAALTALVTAAISWGVNGQKIEQLQRDVTTINARLDRLEDWRLEQAAESQLVRQMAEDVRVIRADVKTLDAKIGEPKKRGRSQ